MFKVETGKDGKRVEKGSCVPSKKFLRKTRQKISRKLRLACKNFRKIACLTERKNCDLKKFDSFDKFSIFIRP